MDTRPSRVKGRTGRACGRPLRGVGQSPTPTTRGAKPRFHLSAAYFGDKEKRGPGEQDKDGEEERLQEGQGF